MLWWQNVAILIPLWIKKVYCRCRLIRLLYIYIEAIFWKSFKLLFSQFIVGEMVKEEFVFIFLIHVFVSGSCPIQQWLVRVRKSTGIRLVNAKSMEVALICISRQRLTTHTWLQQSLTVQRRRCVVGKMKTCKKQVHAWSERTKCLDESAHHWAHACKLLLIETSDFLTNWQPYIEVIICNGIKQIFVRVCCVVTFWSTEGNQGRFFFVWQGLLHMLADYTFFLFARVIKFSV